MREMSRTPLTFLLTTSLAFLPPSCRREEQKPPTAGGRFPPFGPITFAHDLIGIIY